MLSGSWHHSGILGRCGMKREECIQKIRHIQKSMYTFIFEDGKSYKFWAEDADKFYYYLDMIVKYLDEDVPKEQEPKIGHWKRISIDKYVQHAMAYYKCSECGKDIIGEHNYCPNCGAKMSEIPTGSESEVEE